MTGWVDSSRRPLLKVARPDGGPIIAIVDTGFDGALLLSRIDATVLGVDFDEAYEQIGYLAGMRPTRETAGNLRIVWFGEERVVEVVINLDSQHRTIDAREPIALIGTALLEPARLTVDFQRQTLSLRLAR